MSVRWGYSKPAGSTPTTVKGTPSMVSVVPRMSGFAPNRPRHSRCVRMTTRSRPCVSSSSEKLRPSAGDTPSVERKDAVAATARRRSGESWPVSVASPSCEGRHRLQRPRHLAVVPVLEHRDGDPLQAHAVEVAEDAHQALRRCEGHGAQQHPVHHTEDGAVRANPERQRQYRRQGKPRSSCGARAGRTAHPGESGPYDEEEAVRV